MNDGELGRLLSAEDAHRVLGIPASTVRSWYRRKEQTGLWDVGRDNRKHPLFYEADLLALRHRRRIRDNRGRRNAHRPNLLNSSAPDNELCDSPPKAVRRHRRNP